MKTSEKLDEILRRLERLEKLDRYSQPYQVQYRPKRSTCMHENCTGCQNGTCSGVHMISCPCPKCSPQFMCYTTSGYEYKLLPERRKIQSEWDKTKKDYSK